MIVIVLACLAALMLALVLLAAGLHGRRVDDHPVCRRCRFDLSGAPAGSATCPECGADVTGPRAVRVGNRARRGRMLAVAVPLLFVAGGTLSTVTWVNVRGVDLTRFRPASGIIRETHGPDSVMRVALRELTRRVAAGELSDEQVNALADRALAAQADRTRPWVHRWGEFLEAARDAGRLDDSRWSQYLAEAAQFGLVVRPRVRRGDPFPFQVQGGASRVGSDGRLMIRHAAPAVYAGGDVLLGRDPGSAAGVTFLGSGHAETWSEGVIRPGATALAKLADGDQVAEAVVNVTITDRTGQAFHHVVRPAAQFTLLPADQPSVIFRHDSSLPQQFRRAVSVQGVWVAGGSVNVGLDVDQVRYAQPFGVWLRAGGREWRLGTLLSSGGENLLVSGPARGFDATRADLIFRADLQAALELTFITEVWDGEVVLKDLEVKYPQQQPLPGPPQRP